MDGLESELGTKLHIVRLNIQDPVGQQLAPVYHFQATPTFIFFNARGHELWRTVGEVDPQRVRASVASQ